MNKKISVRKCKEYDLHEIYDLITDIYTKTDGPEVRGKKVLIKPNILTDDDPAKCICTHPVAVEAMIRFLQAGGATVFVGDSPAVHSQKFRAEKTGIYNVCEKTGAVWVDFMKNPSERKLRKGKIKVASVIDEVDLIISMPKFKNHELVYFTGAIKNTLGLVPGFSKAKQHALHQDRTSFGEFLVDLNEAVMPDYFLMDAVMGMEGPGPGRGIPIEIGLLLGSTNPLVLDMTASRIAGYEPMVIPTSKTAFFRKNWLENAEDIVYDGPDINTLIKKDFKKIPITGNRNIAMQFLMKRIKPLRKFERRPVFIHKNCTGCLKCVKICPVNAIELHPVKKNYIVLT
ncbi:MAG: FeS-binding protein, partial [Odoribacter sp.]|nr:FeS-binding protein [Odoribacter sp.]